jgi:hypothetical protein
MNNKIKFEYADAWLLLSVIYAHQNGKPSLSKVIGYGDFINHAIFSVEELQGGFFRLIKTGYIIDEHGGYIPTEKIMVSYNGLVKGRKLRVEKELQFIREQLEAPEWSEKYNPAHANKGGSYKNINQKIVTTAYEQYRNEVGGFIGIKKRK